MNELALMEGIINRYVDGIEEKSHKLVDDLAEEAKSMAQSNFSKAFYAGNNDVTVHTEQDNSGKEYGKAVVAEGASVFFIEFGTGIRKADNPEERAQLYGGGAGIVQHGEYGKKRGRQLNGWLYSGEPGLNPPWDTTIEDRHGRTYVRTKGNHANSALYRARQEIARKMRERARGAFK